MKPALVKKLIYPIHEKIIGRETFQSLDMLERLQWLSPEELEEVRLRKLRELLVHAYQNIPFYKERFDRAGFIPEEIQSVDDFKVLPLLSKAEIKENLDIMKEWIK